MSFFDDLVGGENDFFDPIDMFGTRSNREAANIVQQTSREGLDLQRALFDQLREDSAPVRQARNNALLFLQGVDDGTFVPSTSPGFDFRVNEGVGNIRQGAAAGGKFFSGGRLAAEQDFVAGQRANEFNDAVNRLLNLAGFSTGDLNTNNALLQGNVNAQGRQIQNVANADAFETIGRQNSRNQLLNSAAFAGGSVAGEFF